MIRPRPPACTYSGMRYIFLLHLSVFGLIAQSGKPDILSAGFLVGSPINDPTSQVNLFSTFTQGRWTGGPTLELHLPYRFSLEFDALYRNNRTNYSAPFKFGPDVNPYNVSSLRKTDVWDFPLLVKYRFHAGSLRPFVSGGYFWSHESSEATTIYQCSGAQGSCLPAGYPGPAPSFGQYHSSGIVRGLAAGVGVEFKTRYMTIAPEMRFNRPTNNAQHENRFTGLVGFRFGKRS